MNTTQALLVAFKAYQRERARTGANRFPAAYVRPSVLHFGRRQNPRRGPLNTSKEVARRKRQASRNFHNAFKRASRDLRNWYGFE